MPKYNIISARKIKWVIEIEKEKKEEKVLNLLSSKMIIECRTLQLDIT